MKINFTETGWNDYIYWENQDKKALKRINNLIEDITRNSHEGIDQVLKKKRHEPRSPATGARTVAHFEATYSVAVESVRNIRASRTTPCLSLSCHE